MSEEMIAILSVGMGLGLLSTGLFAWLRADMISRSRSGYGPTTSSWPTGSGASNTVRPSWRD